MAPSPITQRSKSLAFRSYFLCLLQSKHCSMINAVSVLELEYTKRLLHAVFSEATPTHQKLPENKTDWLARF